MRKWVPQLSKENIDANQPILDTLTQYSKQKSATNAQISLAWMLHKYPNVVPIPGSKNQERILENLGASKVKLTEQEFTAPLLLVPYMYTEAMWRPNRLLSGTIGK